jgi:hypothetical protein
MRAARRGLFKTGEHVLKEANDIVPIEDHDLERSGVVQMDPNEPLVAVSYDTPYAVRQHEELGFQHDDDRQAKYLETPVNAVRSSHLQDQLIDRELKREFR